MCVCIVSRMEEKRIKQKQFHPLQSFRERNKKKYSFAKEKMQQKKKNGIQLSGSPDKINTRTQTAAIHSYIEVVVFFFTLCFGYFFLFIGAKKSISEKIVAGTKAQQLNGRAFSSAPAGKMPNKGHFIFPVLRFFLPLFNKADSKYSCHAECITQTRGRLSLIRLKTNPP